MDEPPVSFDVSAPSLHSQLFTIRVWQEDVGEGHSEWRGQVRHVMSGETCYFRDWQLLIAFIVKMTTTTKT
ncbi:MAG: hypothetical protein ANABAC_1240 [Anaerolineae bacterium]|nr:MAG: hypothetical protein ANABAC_1240 [Anaerolineae bacterium]